MDSSKDSDLGVCDECQKDGDSSEKVVYYCDLCKKLFCELHKKPKFPYFIDWDTQFDVQGNPAVKAMFFSEYGKQDGHVDFEYLRTTIESMELQEEYQNFLIKTAMDKMMLYGESEGETIPISQCVEVPVAKEEKPHVRKRNLRSSATTTYNNKYGYHFPIPLGIYSFDYYYKELNKAKTLSEVEQIIAEFKKDCKKTQTKPEQVEQPKKKHWWQGTNKKAV
jgi:hypothetical protein